MTNYIPKVGDKVLFGRKSGEQTLGEILRVNGKSVSVKQLEQRGTMKSHPVGTKWKVPMALIRPVDGERDGALQGILPSTIADEKNEPLPFFLKPGDGPVVMAISEIYGALSPDNLTCDGELSAGQVETRRRQYMAKLNALFVVLGRKVSEAVADDWVRVENERKYKIWEYGYEQKRKDTNECITTSPANGGHF